MEPRSAGDKEYFAQDWFQARLRSAGLDFCVEGRNSYPDYWVSRGDVVEGYEVKSLAFAGGRPARKDIDFNSTIPSGRKAGRDIFIVFFLYTGSGISPRSVHTISVVHGDLVNADHAIADEHLNVQIKEFGSFADGFIRNRKMYVFPTPVSLDPGGLGRCRLVVPEAWELTQRGLRHVGTMERKIAPQAVESYTIRLRGRGQAEVSKVPVAGAGNLLRFRIYEADEAVT